MKILRWLLCAGLMLGLARPSHAVKIHQYQGLDGLIKEADVIAIVQVEPASPHEGMQDGWTQRNCYIYQTLKGTIKTGAHHRVPILLNEFVGPHSNFGGASMASTHLVFLEERKTPVSGSRYSIICRRGADLPLPPLGNEIKPAGTTLKAQIQTLLKNYKTYRDQRIKSEDALLDKALKE